mgnify:FL=1|jgi:hypothetical protein
MAGYSLNTTRDAFQGGKNILASEHFQFVHGGATLKASVIGAVKLEVGTAIMRKISTGFYEKYADATGAIPVGYDNFSILNVDVQLDGVNDVVVGEVLIRGSVYDAKLNANVTAAFKTETKDKFFFVKHI